MFGESFSVEMRWPWPQVINSLSQSHDAFNCMDSNRHSIPPGTFLTPTDHSNEFPLEVIIQNGVHHRITGAVGENQPLSKENERNEG